MRLTIIKQDNAVYIDGVVREIDCSSLDASFHALQWNGTTGEIEVCDPETGKLIRNDEIDTIASYQSFVDAWNAQAAAEAQAAAQDASALAALAALNAQAAANGGPTVVAD
jgi:hypothetical protein